MNAADLDAHAWQIVLAVCMLCVAGVTSGFSLSPQTKADIGVAVALPFHLLSFLLGAVASYKMLVRHWDLAIWGVAVWAAFVFLGSIATLRYLVKTFSGGSTGAELRT